MDYTEVGGSSWDNREEEDSLQNQIDKFWVDDVDHEDAHAEFTTNPHHPSSTRTLLPPTFNLQEVDSNSRPPLGLKLNITPSFLSLLEKSLSTPQRQIVVSQPGKLKASNFYMTAIKIGSWQCLSIREGDLTAKLYYAKRKLVWEVLNGPLKSKMEILWSDITAIKASFMQHLPDQAADILQIQLDKPPLFFRENAPQPKKHTTWQSASDFTGGQASLYRGHIIKFPTGVLAKHYEKLLQCDQHLLDLSRKPFPSQESPYFNTDIPLDISVNFNGPSPSFMPPVAQQHFNGCRPNFLPHVAQQHFNGHDPSFMPSVAQQHPHTPAAYSMTVPHLNPTITVNTHNRDERGRGYQLAKTVRDAERSHFPRQNPYFEEPSTSTGQYCPQAFLAGDHYASNNPVTVNEIDNLHLLGQSSSQIMRSGIVGQNSRLQPMGASSSFNPYTNLNALINQSGLIGSYHMSDEKAAVDVDQVVTMQNGVGDDFLPLMQHPITWLPPPPLQGCNDSLIGMEPHVADNCPNNSFSDEDLFSILYRKS